MRSFSPLQMFMTLLSFLALCLFIIAPKNSPGEVRREVLSLTIPAGETASNTVATAMNGTSKIALAEAASVSTPTVTITMESWLGGGSISSMTLASDTMATTATTTTELDSLKEVPLAGEIRFSASASGGPEEDLTVNLLILYKEEH